MGTYVAARYYPGYEFEISTLFWGALILVALVVACLFAWKAIQWLLNRRKFDGAADEGEHPEDPKDPWAQAISRPLADHHYGDEGGLGGMSQREQEQLFSTYAPRKVRKEMKRRLRAREQAQKHQYKS